MLLPKKNYLVSFRVDPETHARLQNLGFSSAPLAARAIVERILHERSNAPEELPSFRDDLTALERLVQELTFRLATLRVSPRAPESTAARSAAHHKVQKRSRETRAVRPLLRKQG